MTVFVPREQWGARPRKSGIISIVEHPSVTFHWVGGGWEFPWDHSSCDDKVRGIQASHMDSRGWSDIAYNYLACPHNYVFEGRGYDRRSSANGSDQANYYSFAVCALWGSASTDDTLPAGLKWAMLYARNILRSSGGATIFVKGHKDWKSTDCPGAQIYAWIQADLPLPGSTSKDFKVATLADLTTVVNKCIADACLDGGKIHETVQAYSAFNAENLRQRIGDIANASEAEQLDDFAALAVMIEHNKQQLEGLASVVDAIRQKLNTHTA